MTKMLIRNLRKHEAKIATMNGVQNWSALQSKYNINKKNIKFLKNVNFLYSKSKGYGIMSVSNERCT